MYRKILLAVDGSLSSDLALIEASTLAKAMDSDVMVVFVADDSDVMFDVGYFDPVELRQAIVRFGQDALASAARRLSADGVRHATRLIEKPVAPGRIAATIVSEADAGNADLIVLGTHGRRGIRRMVMGSVAEGVLRLSRKPVLLIRSEIDE